MKPALSVFALMAIASAAQAAVSTFTQKADFLNAVQNPHTETFDSLTVEPSQPIFFTSGSYAFQASVPDGQFFNVGLPSPGDVWLSTVLSGTSMLFTFTSGNILAVGGSFFSSDFNGDPNLGGIGLRVNGTTAYLLPQTNVDLFWGIVSDDPIDQLEVYPLDSLAGDWATVNDLIIGGNSTVSAIPETASSLALAGLIAGGVCLRRRAARGR